MFVFFGLLDQHEKPPFFSPKAWPWLAWRKMATNDRKNCYYTVQHVLAIITISYTISQYFAIIINVQHADFSALLSPGMAFMILFQDISSTLREHGESPTDVLYVIHIPCSSLVQTPKIAIFSLDKWGFQPPLFMRQVKRSTLRRLQCPHHRALMIVFWLPYPQNHRKTIGKP